MSDEPSGAVTEPGESEAELESLRATVCAMAGLLAAEMCRWLDLVGELDRTHAWSGYGIKSSAHWLSWACSMSAGTAREHVRVAKVLPQLPLIHAAFAAGEQSYSKVREATRLAGRIDESALLNLSRVCTAAQLHRSVQGFRRADTDRLQQELTRSVRWRTDDDGSLILTARLPAEEGAIVLAALETATGQLSLEKKATEKTPTTSPPGASDDPALKAAAELAVGATPWTTPAGRAARAGTGVTGGCGTESAAVNPADALLAVARGFLDGSPADTTGQDRNLVVVHVDAAVLAAGAASSEEPELPAVPVTDVPAGTPLPAVPATGACEIVGVGGITAETAAKISCDASVIPVVRNRSGAVLNLGRKRRLVSAAQRRALAIRDGCCRYPSCTRTQALEAHHVKHWAAGGRTDMDNLVMLCRFHHLAIHENIAAVASTRTGRTLEFSFTRPNGEPLPDDPTERRRMHRGIEEHQELQVRRRLDSISEPSAEREWQWNDQDVEAIRPLWRGERFDLHYVVAALFSQLAGKEAA